MISSYEFLHGLLTRRKQCTTCVEQTGMVTFEQLNQSANLGRCHICVMIRDTIPQYLQLRGRSIADINRIWPHWGRGEKKSRIYVTFLVKDSRTRDLLEFCPFKESSELIPLNISGNTGSERAFSWALNCFQTCLEKHISCKPDRHSSIPTRVLDLGSLTLGLFQNEVKLYETQNDDAAYACLSHCWGEFQPVQTTNSNIDGFKSGIPWISLPRTFQDAIIFTRKLGIRYLWIDSLCIIQDDKEDKQREIRQMCSIFENSAITLQATKSENATGGCFAVTEPRFFEYPIKPIKSGGQTWTVTLFPHRMPHDEFGDYRWQQCEPLPLLKRAWVFQERMLPPRVLHFGPQELLWECAETSTCECGNEDFAKGSKKLQHKRYLMDMVHHRDLSWWFRIVEDYTGLGFSFDEDRLSALEGLAAQFSTHRDDTYILGLWEASLATTLAWKVNWADIWRRNVYIQAPSWSWASVCTRAGYWEGVAKEMQSHCSTLRVRSNGSGSNDSPVATPYVLEASGYLTQVTLEYFPAPQPNGGDRTWDYMIVPGRNASKRATKDDIEINVGEHHLKEFGGFESFALVYEFYADYLLHEEGPHQVREGDTLYCLKLCTSGFKMFSLVLRRVHVASNIFERVGLLDHYLWEDRRGCLIDLYDGVTAETRLTII